MTNLRRQLHRIANSAADFREGVHERPAGTTVSFEDLKHRLFRPCPLDGADADPVLRELIRDVDPGLIASAGPRYFGFVTGGSLPAALMADWMTAAWDQNAQAYESSPAAGVVESIVESWILEILGLPPTCSAGFVTGCQLAHVTALSCALKAVLAQAGWSTSKNGLFGAPTVVVFMSDQIHVTVRTALRLLGVGEASERLVASDNEGRMHPGRLKEHLEAIEGPKIIVGQAGNVNTGAFEALGELVLLAQTSGAWIHIDGAFGLWAATSLSKAHLLAGFEGADSWVLDAHKWLNVPYDSGLVIIRNQSLHRSLKELRCAYAGEGSPEKRDGSAWVPENSRRARGFVLYAALRQLGKAGIAEIVERCCALAREMADGIHPELGQVVNTVCLNQVLVALRCPAACERSQFHHDVAKVLQSTGICWMGTTVWKGETVLRISITNHSTTSHDVRLSLTALVDASGLVADQRRVEGNAPGRA